MEKTIDDCTREDFARLATAAHELLSSAMMSYWLNGCGDGGDRSEIEAIEEMRAAFLQCGIRVSTMEEFAAGVERTLKLSPEEFFAQLGKNESP